MKNHFIKLEECAGSKRRHMHASSFIGSQNYCELFAMFFSCLIYIDGIACLVSSWFSDNRYAEVHQMLVYIWESF